MEYLNVTTEPSPWLSKQGVVVVNKAGQVITAYTSQYFDDDMKNLVEQLFGK